MLVTALSPPWCEGFQMCSSTPNVTTPLSRLGSASRRTASTSIASQAVCQSTPRWRASAETVVSSWANASVAHLTARVVSLARGSINGWVSENTPTGHPVSGQRQTRLRQATTTGLPNAGASCARWTRRPWPTATTPQARQPVASSSVSTVTTSQPPASWPTSITCRPGALNISSARAHQGAPTPHLLSDTSGSPDERLLGRYRSSRPRRLPPRTATQPPRDDLTHAQLRRAQFPHRSGRSSRWTSGPHGLR